MNNSYNKDEVELIEIVDENGNFTGEIMGREEAHNKNLLHNEIAVFVINDKKEVLLQKRSVNKRFNPNKWAICAGHVTQGESLENAALRELKEEIGINASRDNLKSFAKKEFIIKDSNSHISNFFYIKVNQKEEDFVIQEGELSEVKWFNIDDVINMILSHDESIVFKENKLYLFEYLKKL